MCGINYLPSVMHASSVNVFKNRIYKYLVRVDYTSNSSTCGFSLSQRHLCSLICCLKGNRIKSSICKLVFFPANG